MMLTSLILLSSLSIPLSDDSVWQQLDYSRIPSNEVVFKDQSLKINVSDSASPLVFPFGEPRNVQAVKVEGQLSNLITLPAGVTQGTAQADDFTLRIGLVVKGENRLTWLQRELAPEWIKTLYSLAPVDAGIDSILFLVATQDSELLNTQRVHPLSELINEHFVWHLDKAGAFSLSVELPERKEIIALWLSSDGDQTASEYAVTLNQLILM